MFNVTVQVKNLIVVIVVQQCSTLFIRYSALFRPDFGPNYGFGAQILPAPPIGGAKKSKKRPSTLVIAFIGKHTLLISIPSCQTWTYVGRIWSSMTKSRSFGGQISPNLGTLGVPSHSEVTVCVIVQPKSLTLSLLLFTEPHCCLLLLFNSNNKNSR